MASLRPGDALALYMKAYAISKEPALLYNMARAREAVGDYPGAITDYLRFKHDAPPELVARIPRFDELIADLKSRVTTVTIHCNVPGARVLVRDAAVGEIPRGGLLEKILDAGPATIEVTAEGYAPHREQTVLPKGGVSAFDVVLVKKLQAGILSVSTSPVPGDVFIDDKAIGKAPVESTVTAGAHKIVVRHDGYSDVESQAVAEVGQTKRVTLTFEGKKSIVAAWWFWTAIGVVGAGTAAGLYAAFKSRSPDTGSIQTTTAPLVRF